MKKIISAFQFFSISAFLCCAAMPVYTTKTATGSTSAEVTFLADGARTIRIVGAIATSDKAGAVLSLRTGETAYQIGYTNAAGTNIYVTTTNGLAAADVLVIQTALGSNVSAVVHALVNSTNVALTATTGFATRAGDSVYKMSAASTLPVAAATVSYQGEAVYAGNRGRPVRAVLDGTSACTINSVTVRYD
jgi:hypothetical protein